MTDTTLGRWLLAVLAIVGLAIAVSVVGAHGDEPVADETDTHDGGTWAAWMDGHVGSGTIAEMQSHMGVAGDDMPHETAARNHTAGGMNGQGPGC
ncbi:hypothetical protein [Halovivax cerinus]|uniref:Uncharacterized protein n=1 Tax=Halovivax cerinus TaxID=1487865 RepID=A0ABD5NRE1_9EURY|nr:hypothetical protein [Halovivax cerinus]